MSSRKTTKADMSWRGDAAWISVAFTEAAVLVIVAAILITFFRGAGFWPWFVMAGAIALCWLTAVVLLIQRSAPRR